MDDAILLSMYWTVVSHKINTGYGIVITTSATGVVTFNYTFSSSTKVNESCIRSISKHFSHWQPDVLALGCLCKTRTEGGHRQQRTRRSRDG